MTRVIDLNQKQKKRVSSLPLVIGSFDVIHKGHIKIFNYIKKQKFNILLVVNSPKTSSYFSNLNQRIFNLKSLNPNIIYVFDVHKNNLSALNFIEDILNSIQPSVVLVGEDFKFGKNKGGDVQLLQRFLKVKTFKKNIRLQTSLIKQFYLKGQIQNANKKLFLPITYTSTVSKGSQIGRTYNYPTLNLVFKDGNLVLPPNGIYATQLMYKTRKYKGATYVKHFDKCVCIETYALNAKLPFNNYGEQANITFLAKLHAPKKCDKGSVSQKHQVEKMVKLVENFFKD